MRQAVETTEIPSSLPAGSGGRLLLPAGLVFLFAGSAVALSQVLGNPRSGSPEPPHSLPLPVAVPAAPRMSAPETDKFLTAPVELSFDGKTLTTTWKDLGFARDESASGPVPVTLDRKKALQVVVGFKDSYDRPSNDARVDLVNRKVMPETKGYGIDVYGAIASLDEAARAGKLKAELVGAETEPAVTVAKLGNLDISHVMGSFETHYPPGERDRNYNLRLVAEHVNGHILMQHETFSFNEIVGDRTEKQGYRVAHVIQAGEMIDGLAGGACQISTTLHGAAWFAGLDLVHSIPHSRPSAYVTMGLDATVVYPTTDLKLRNPYEFPVVIHYVVAQGTVRVEILGQKRPWDRVAFEREIKKELPFETVTREDDELPLGTQVIDQVGFPGYQLQRRRIFYTGKKDIKTEKWDISYPPTTEYVRVGSNPDPNLVPPEAKEPKGLPNPGGKTYHLEQ